MQQVLESLAMRPIPERDGMDAASFRRDVLPAYTPMVIRGLVRDWPMVREGLRSPHALAELLRTGDVGRPVETFIGPASIGGRFFYDAAMTGFNFQRRVQPLTQTLSWLLSQADAEAPEALYVGALDARSVLPGLAAEMKLDLVDAAVAPRVWIGNRVEISAHFDQSHNIACVAGGRRRFTLFPPDQVANLYVGPLDFTVAGQPLATAASDPPDFAKHPRLAEALASALSAELEPGDAIYIPPLWWHHVRSLSAFNVLVNFWWEETPPGAGSPFESLVHGLLAIRGLPERERLAWRAMFDHYVFQTGDDPAAHLKPEVRGILGTLTPELSQRIRSFLVRGLQRG